MSLDVVQGVSYDRHKKCVVSVREKKLGGVGFIEM